MTTKFPQILYASEDFDCPLYIDTPEQFEMTAEDVQAFGGEDFEDFAPAYQVWNLIDGIRGLYQSGHLQARMVWDDSYQSFVEVGTTVVSDDEILEGINNTRENFATSDEFLEGIITAYEDFATSDEFEGSIIDSTKAGWGGSSYSVELFPDGHYQICWTQQIGNRYASPGIILVIPKCTNDEIADDNDDWYLDNAIEAFHEMFASWKADYQDYQAFMADNRTIRK